MCSPPAERDYAASIPFQQLRDTYENSVSRRQDEIFVRAFCGSQHGGALQDKPWHLLARKGQIVRRMLETNHE